MFTLIDYVDVYRDFEGNWCVNNLCSLTKVKIPDNMTDQELINLLIGIGYLNPSANENNILVLWDDENLCELEQVETGEPLCRLVRETEEHGND